MTKSPFSRFASLVVIVVIAIAVILTGAYFISSRNSDEQMGNTESTSQVDADKPLDTAVSNSIDDIEKELNALTEADYSDKSLSDTTLYE